MYIYIYIKAHHLSMAAETLAQALTNCAARRRQRFWPQSQYQRVDLLQLSSKTIVKPVGFDSV